jgi:hypothetical protein
MKHVDVLLKIRAGEISITRALEELRCEEAKAFDAGWAWCSSRPLQPLMVAREEYFSQKDKG